MHTHTRPTIKYPSSIVPLNDDTGSTQIELFDSVYLSHANTTRDETYLAVALEMIRLGYLTERRLDDRLIIFKLDNRQIEVANITYDNKQRQIIDVAYWEQS